MEMVIYVEPRQAQPRLIEPTTQYSYAGYVDSMSIGCDLNQATDTEGYMRISLL